MASSKERKSTQTKNKILIADDEEMFLDIYATNFKKRGHQVITATDGEEALEKAKLEKPSVIVLDLEMPKMTGLEVLEKLRENADTRDTPVIILTLIDDKGSIGRARALGADYILKKDMTPKEIVEEVIRLSK